MGILGRLLSGKKDAAAKPGAAGPNEAADAHIVQGQRLEDEHQLAAAESAFRRAVSCAPGYPRAHLNLGNALHKQGRLEEAAQAHREAARLDPAYAPAHFNLGTVLLALGDTAGARTHLAQALATRPDMADAAVLLAEACDLEGDGEGARRHLEAALAIDPRLAGAAANLGVLHVEAGRIAEARAAFENALAIDPRNGPALCGMGRIAMMQGDAARAASLFQQASALDPADLEAWTSYLFALNFRGDLDAKAIAHEHFRFGDAFAPAVPAPRGRVRAQGRRLRVGYVSADFMKHPVGLFMRPVLREHDGAGFETFCYSNGTREDEVSAELRGLAGHWRPIRGRSDEWVAELVRRDGIDILVDLSGHTAHNRLGVFARRAAPVQATWLGYLNTTGLTTMDHRICDARTDPPGTTEALNRETLARMPHSQWCYAPYYEVAPGAARADPGERIVFGAFNQFAKASDACLDLWCEVLRALPRASLRVHAVPEDAEDAFLERLARRGVQASRVALRPRLGILEYFAAIADVDIALDSYPYNGATTTLDTLWMGVPVVALAGERSISRGTYSICAGAGLDELLADSPRAWVERNVALARDAAARASLRQSLRPRLERSPLMDARRFTRDLEDLYRRMAAGAAG